ncbi:mitochondrial carrier [Backusella circina FSU 941]|nr:mitochondrial carrier [Backusella circina FSU 941]
MAESANDFIAGWIGGAAGILVGSPLDVLKARLQAPKTNPVIGAELVQPSGSWQTLRNMVQTEGLGSMFKGVLSPVIGLAGLNALLFVSYGSIIRYFEYHDHNVTKPFQPTLSEVYLAGFGAGVACFFFSTPTDLIKIKAQMSKTSKTTMEIAKEVLANNGIRGFYQGGWITMIRDAPSYGIYFWVYEGTKRLLEAKSDDDAWKLLLAGGLAGTISWASIYPIDVVKSRLQMQHVPTAKSPGETSSLVSLNRPYVSIKDCVVRSYKTEGLGVFFRGLGPTLLRGFPVNAVTFYAYEVVMKLLGT